MNMRFKEWLTVLEGPIMPPPNPAMTNNPANKAAVQQTLMAALKAPAPPGSNPAMYQGKIKQAIGMNKATPAPNAAAAMDMVNVSMKASQP